MEGYRRSPIRSQVNGKVFVFLNLVKLDTSCNAQDTPISCVLEYGFHHWHLFLATTVIVSIWVSAVMHETLEYSEAINFIFHLISKNFFVVEKKLAGCHQTLI